MIRKAEKAEARAERYDMRSENAIQRCNALQKPINDMHGDIAFFTQPNINTSSGRAFTRRRDKMFAAWERGFEEFKKSEYYEERARAARTTASNTKPTDKGFIDRRIKDAEKTIRAQQKNLESYRLTLEKINQGIEVKTWSSKTLTASEVEKWIEDAEIIIEQAISKSIYYHECLSELGGVSFSKENILPGYIVKLSRWGECKVVGVGPVNISYEILTGGAAGLGGKATYAEIQEIISDKVSIDSHPFKEGEEFTVRAWNGSTYADKTYRVTKVTADKVTLKSGNERAISRKPRRFKDGTSYSWALGIVDGLNGTIYRKAE